MCPFLDNEEIEGRSPKFSSQNGFDVGNVSKFFKRDNQYLLIGAGIAFVILIVVLTLINSGSPINIEELPVIHAEQTEFKEKPKANLTVQHQDKVVYDNISGDSRVEREKLAPRPENVIEIPDMSESETLSDEEKRNIIRAFDELAPQKEYTVKYNKQSTDIKPERLEPSLTVTENRRLQILKNKPKLTNKEHQELKIIEKKLIGSYKTENVKDIGLPPINNITNSNIRIKKRLKDVINAKKSQENSAERVITHSRGTVMIQIASVPSKAAAESEYRRLVFKNKFLKGKGKKIFKIDLGSDKGIRYRIQIGPFKNKEDANKIINALRANGCSAYISK
ncbi:MAG: hypothetical protein E7015_00755 [Alphaproteobacteria bacterium]|nr:hypothetical protein [Alphaproteobacteria bacterium]